MPADSQDTFRPIHNPYIVGNPIRDRKMFFGREDDFGYIQQKVSGDRKGGLIVLCGTRRSGKTSILFQIMSGRLGNDYFPVLIDMQAMVVETEFDFLLKLGRGIVDAVDAPGVSLEKDFIEKRGEGLLVAFDNLVRKTIQSLSGKKLILLFDEYELFESHIEKKFISTEILNLFRSWIDHEEGVFMIFTGSDTLEQRRDEYWEPFLSKALHQRISFLSRSDTRRLIEEPLKGDVHYEGGLPEKIYELTAGQPFYTQVFCQALVDHANEVKTRDLVGSDLQQVIDQIIENPLPQMIFSWNSLSNLEKLALSIIGELNKETVRPVRATEILAFAKKEHIRYRIDPNSLSEALEKLFHHDMLSKEGAGEEYTFKMDLWRRWMGRMHSIWQVIDEIKGAEELGEGLALDPGRGARLVPVLAGVAVLAAVVLALVYFVGTTGAPENSSLASVDSTSVTIHTEPPQADVYLNDVLVGKAPIDRWQVPAGVTTLSIQKEGYRDFRDTMDLQKDTPFDTSIALVERMGHLELRSTPSGADIYVGTEHKGRTDTIVRDLSINESYDVRLTLAGYNPIEQRDVRIYEDSVFSMAFDFDRSRSDVLLVSQPIGADILLDGERVGVTPGTHTVAHGTHELVLRLEGYVEVTRDITAPVAGGRIDAALTKLPPGTLTIKPDPWADIYVDGNLVKKGAVNYVATLEQGKHTIRLVHRSFEDLVEEVWVTSGESRTVDYDMEQGARKQ